ncbi:hypothetical protein FVP74_00965 [Microbacterium saccharophilum]|uniref:SbsA Ig-like domain-containing protein n=1 Tax=Microbacterium saccharophilum TaxID=1213358 RepID=A0A5C8I6H3_9MICO|nr:hypothetical protein [Microbacterium saccharophilum]TXK15027.1 hypothetical protein FVP74_00965 [Microbacterium saccharophilum]GEP47432.1 hypothetical protein MSA03_09400 [Microbacterium saccharophilum]
MSTDPPTRRSQARQRRSRAFTTSFAVVIGVLAAVGLGGAALTTAQGPRITQVQIDAEAAVAASGSRILFTTTQSLAEVTAEQVTVSPAADFTVDTAGRTVGVRFALPLWDATEYTVTISDVAGIGGGPAATITETFTTPPLEVYLLQRGEGEDTVFRTGLAGDAAVPVFTAPHIEDFRATSGHLVIATRDDEDLSELIVTALDGSDPRTLPLPGDGMVTNLQSADRGDLIGYTFTDADIGPNGGRESVLHTASLGAGRADDDPTPITIEGGDYRVEDWRFVPGTDSVLLLTFDGALTLASAAGGEPVALGNAVVIHGIARGSTQALVERIDGLARIDLATADEEPLAGTAPDLGQPGAVTPLPGGTGETLRVLAHLDGFTVISTDVAVVDADGSARTVFTVPPEDTLLQTCVSPSGRYAALLVAPDMVDNPYDGYALPLPTRLETHVIALAGDAPDNEIVALSGFDISWCQNATRG